MNSVELLAEDDGNVGVDADTEDDSRVSVEAEDTQTRIG